MVDNLASKMLDVVVFSVVSFLEEFIDTVSAIVVVVEKSVADISILFEELVLDWF